MDRKGKTKKGIEGIWYNELGSRMKLTVNGNGISGTYKSKVGDAEGEYKIFGARVPTSGESNQALGFVVAWANDSDSTSSVTCWSGQWQIVDGKEEINTMWLLTSVELPEDDWKSTLVGRDIFTRTKPSSGKATEAAQRAPGSQPRTLN